MQSESVWIVDDDSSIRWVLQKALQGEKISCQTFENPNDVLLQLDAGYQPQVIISDIRMPQMDGMDLLTEVRNRNEGIPVIIMTAHSDLDSAVNAYQSGAFEYLPKPFDLDDASTLVRRALNHAQENARQKQEHKVQSSSHIIGEAPAMQEVFRAIGRLSRSSISVLINGQSGTGKELVAKALHRHSPRADNPFIALNMAAIPADLVESELFGHEKGAFTGAQGNRQGRFEQANGGTLFLDEIGDMPLDVQTRLLRVLADGQFYRVGGHQSVSVDVRIIAATHQDLEQRVADGAFREDLFHRLNVIRVHMPALNERQEDIPLLIHHFLQIAARELEVDMKSIHQNAMDVLCQFSWPGNVRQLENMCRWLTVMASGKEILREDLPPEVFRQNINGRSQADWKSLLGNWALQQLDAGEQDILTRASAEFESVLLKCALEYTQGHKQLAAKKLGWGRNTLTRKLKELKL